MTLARPGSLPWCAAVVAACLSCAGARGADAAAAPKPRTTAQVIAESTAADWRGLDPDRTLYLQLPKGRVVIELAPDFAPLHVANLRTLVRERYFDGLAIVRSQDNFVVQWGDPTEKRGLGSAQATVPPEFVVAGGAAKLPFAPLPDADGYAPEAGFSFGFPAARDRAGGDAWLVHCYGMVGVGRADDPASGSGAELYVVTGHAPRQLDRNIALVGRVVRGMELLSTLPRGTGPLGFYESAQEYVPIASVRFAAEVPDAERERIELMRTDSASFRALVESRRNRRDDWYVAPAGHVDICNVPLVTRVPP